MDERKPIAREILLFGSEQLVPTRRVLRAGPLSLVLQDGAIRYVKIGETELVRRFYMALRDQNWNTIPTTFSDWNFDVGPDSFRISFSAENRKDEINFAWKGSIIGDSSGKVTYSMTGKALSNFKKRIIGLCALFPILECAGQSASVVRRNGEEVATEFPLFIDFRQPLPGFEDINGLSFKTRNSGIPVQVKFEGDTFEMEDQRSFTDASYKVYSTWTKTIEAEDVGEGDETTQSISASIPNWKNFESSETVNPVIIEADLRKSIRLPEIGLGISSGGESLAKNELDLLNKVGISHLRGDLDLTSDGWKAEMRRLSDQSRQLAVGLELAIFVDANASEQMECLDAELNDLQPSVESILVFDLGELASKPESVSTARKIFGDYDSRPKIGGGTNRNYYDLALFHPSFSQDSVVSFSVNPQVHAFDVSSLVETLEGQSWTVRSAHKVFEKNPIRVSPVTLKPRFNPDAIVPEVTGPNELPSAVDPRQVSLFGACWTAGSVKALAESEVSSLTYYGTVGWRGLMETGSGSKLPSKFLSKPGMVFPLYHVLRDICEMSGGMVHVTRSSKPLAVEAFLAVKGSLARMLVYNLTWEPQEVSIRGTRANEARIRRLNEETAESAMFSPDEFRAEPGQQMVTGESGELNLKLLPYEVAKIEYGYSGR